MKRMRTWLLAGVTACCLAGCAGQAGNPAPKSPSGAADLARQAVEASGGAEAWQAVERIDAKVLLETCLDGGAPYHCQAEVRMYPGQDRLIARADAGRGAWRAEVNSRGEGTVQTRGRANVPVTFPCLKRALGELLHRSRGAGNFPLGRETPVSAGTRGLEGRELYRLGVDAARYDTRAYYLDAETYLPRYVTSGADERGKDGSVTIYSQYVTCPGGVVFPMRIVEVRIGEYTLIGSQRRWAAEFVEVTMVR